MSLGDAVHVFIYNFFPFVVQLIFCEGLFCFKRKRRQMFVVKLVGGIAVMAGLMFGLACITIVMPDSPLLGTLPYVALFAFSVLVLCLCFDVPTKMLILHAIAAYAAQNTLYRVVSLFDINGVVWDFSQAVGSYFVSYNLISALVFIVLAPIVYYAFVRRINRQYAENFYSRNILLIAAVTFGIVLVLCSYTNAWAWQSYVLSIVEYCLSMLGNVFVLAMISGMFENLGLKNEIATVRQLWAQDKRQYEIAKENIDIINIKCHDLKHKIRALRSSEATDEELSEIENAVEIYDSTVHTGCAPLDVVLTEKSLICTKRNIKLTCMADGSRLSFMSEFELYSLFGNMLTNAVNAVCDMEDEDSRVIDLTVTNNAGFIMINCINYFSGEIVMNGNLPKTSSGNIAEHGFGMKSMSMLVKKYGGEMCFTAENGVFDLKIALPISGGAEACVKADNVA